MEPREIRFGHHPIIRQKTVAALDALRDHDREMCHSEAEDIVDRHLRAIGHGEVADAFARVLEHVFGGRY